MTVNIDKLRAELRAAIERKRFLWRVRHTRRVRRRDCAAAAPVRGRQTLTKKYSEDT
jgi:hypothetical protein